MFVKNMVIGTFLALAVVGGVTIANKARGQEAPVCVAPQEQMAAHPGLQGYPGKTQISLKDENARTFIDVFPASADFYSRYPRETITAIVIYVPQDEVFSNGQVKAVAGVFAGCEGKAFLMLSPDALRIGMAAVAERVSKQKDSI